MIWYAALADVKSFSFNGLEDLFELVSCQLMAGSLNSGNTFYRASVSTTTAATETQYNGAVSRFTAVDGGRLALREHEINKAAKTSFITWEEGIAVVTWDGSQLVTIEYAASTSGLYSSLSSSCYIALSASW